MKSLMNDGILLGFFWFWVLEKKKVNILHFAALILTILFKKLHLLI